MNISQILESWCLDQNLIYKLDESIESTNDLAKKSLNLLASTPAIFIAEIQTQGRGRGTNQWLTPGKNNSLLTSWVFQLPSAPQAITGPLIGLCLYRSVKNVWPQLQWSIKPPNDLRLNNKKIAGLLIEAVQQGTKNYLIVGLGFNLLNHPESLTEATHLNSENGLNGNLQEDQLRNFFKKLLNEFESALEHIIQSQMNQQHCDELCLATGADSISPSGDIQINGQLLSWKDL